MNKIAVFGGSFDPVHKAHTEMAKETLMLDGVEKIIFVPAYVSPHKTKCFADVDGRIAMLKLAVKNIERAEISFFEIEKQERFYSYQTLDYFQSLYPAKEIMMLIGSDSLQNLRSWENIDYLVSHYRFIVAKRFAFDVDENTKYAGRCVFLKEPMKDISSTQVRGILKENGEDAKDLLDPQVYDYIKEYGLYK